MSSTILDMLNDKQREAVISTEGPVLILAGAGSGKTRCIVHRIAYLISEKKVSPYNILAVTFTNKAANEMKERLENQFGIHIRSLWVGTFHSMCARILRSESQYLPVTQNFTIYDEIDQQRIMKNVLKEINLAEANFPVKKILNIISNQKNNLIEYDEFSMDDSYYGKYLAEIYEAYQKYIIKNNGVDFDDLLLYIVKLFENHKEVLARYQDRFKYVMIDEYQDTNFAQYRFAYLLAKKHKNLCVVGDDDQSIYSWRGANVGNILSFEDDYDKPHIIRMTQNYRSTKRVLSASNELISHNQSRHEKELWTDKEEGKQISLYNVQNERQEAATVSQKIQELQNTRNVSLKDIAVFYRSNAQSRVFETQFIKDHIDYRIVGGVNFFQRKEIKDIVAYLRLIANTKDNESFMRIVNFPKRGIGQTTVSHLLDFAVERQQSLLEVIDNIEGCESLTTPAKEHLVLFKKMIDDFVDLSQNEPINNLVKKVVDVTEILDFYTHQDTIESESKADNIREFVASTDEFAENFITIHDKEPSLQEYMQNLSLVSDIDYSDTDRDVVSLMTMHNAKGLEFPYVFIVGAEDGLIPHRNSMESSGDIEEERRLFYVAMTRTIKELSISYAQSRRYYDSTMSSFPSRFLNEMNTLHFQMYDLTHFQIDASSVSNHRKQKKTFDLGTKDDTFRVGQRVEHTSFGKGRILSIRKDGELIKLTISFDSGELKKIISDYIKVL
ncbi:MAG: UvrD-helicase domain-containing protein [Candidatus Cloacimonetes bacterium]|nr:UvrD-helicase domain-containing protein [Candidatus Cloacimonadota bacterium]